MHEEEQQKKKQPVLPTTDGFGFADVDMEEDNNGEQEEEGDLF